MTKKRCFGCMQLKESSPVCEHCGFNENVQNESHQLPMGTVLRGQYMVGKALGQGGFGITYLGWDLNLDIPIAIKEYYPNSIVNRDATHNPALTGVASNMMEIYVSTRQRFLREAKVLAMLRNIPNIVQVHNFFEENNTAYIVMEYVRGIDLRRYMNMRGGRLSVEETLAILRPVMEALARVHDHEIVHRDISPDNIMMMANGVPKLLDFGAVRNIESANADQDLQHSTEAILKHGFAPMEQYQKRGALGPWTDEYAMCATVYYCLTGRVPPDAPQRMMEDVHPAWDKIPGLSAYQRMVLEKGMSLRGKDRYPDIRSLMAALYGAEPQPVTEPIMATKPVEPMEMPAPAPIQEAEEPAYTAPMMTAPVEPIPVSAPEKPPYTEPMVTKPVERVPEKPKKKKLGVLGIFNVIIAMLLCTVVIFVVARFLPNEQEETSTEVLAVTTETVETTVLTEPTEPPPAWKDNILMKQIDTGGKGIGQCGDVAAFGTDIPRSRVRSVTFQSTLEGAPEKTYDVSLFKDGSVQAWVKDEYSWMKDMIIAAEGGINAKYCDMMFYEFNNLQSITFGDAFHTDDCTSMWLMFRGCYQLWQLDVSTFNTSKVKNMRAMFEACPLQKLDLSTWDTSKVTDMSCLFSNCDKLTELDLTGWDTSNVTDMSCMFLYCDKLKSLDLNHFDTFKVTDMSYMFRYCSMLNTIKIGSWNTSKVKSMEGMFEQCWNLGDLSLFNWDRLASKNVKHNNFLPAGKTINGQPWEEFFQ